MLNLSTLCSLYGLTLSCKDVTISGVSTDSRQINPGDLFIALEGEQFDGHAYLQEAVQRGCVAAVVNKTVHAPIPLIHVSDTRQALGKLAEYWRSLWQLKIIALTGSCGKTTVKEMLASILHLAGETVAPPRSWNNNIGVPLTLLKIRSHHRYAVMELGANHVGEISYLTRLVRPSVALITNVSPAHLQGFGNLNRIANAKAEIFEGLLDEGVAILNAEDEFYDLWKRRLGSRRIVTFGLRDSADVRASIVDMHPSNGTEFIIDSIYGDASVKLKLVGEHNVRNALAAFAAASALGVELDKIKEGLETCKPVKGRLMLYAGLFGAKVIDDTYNANIGSIKAALQVLSEYPGERVLVLGDFLELGVSAPDYHYQMGAWAKSLGIDKLFAYGELARQTVRAFGQQAYLFETKQALVEALKIHLNPNAVVLVKGSRGSKMEEIVAALISPEEEVI